MDMLPEAVRQINVWGTMAVHSLAPRDETVRLLSFIYAMHIV